MQYNKVEICGVNTSKLKVLNEKEKIPVDTLMQLYDILLTNSIEDLLRGKRKE